MKRLILITVFLVSFPLFFIAQVYVPIDTADNRKASITKREAYVAKNKIFLGELKHKFPAKEAKYITKSFEEMQKEFAEELEKGKYILIHDSLNYFVNKIVEDIVKANPSIPKDLDFYISRDLSLNAYSMGDKNFVLNLGLFSYLDNEAQFAAIISHEIGHLLLKHGIKVKQETYRKENDKKNKEDLKKLKLEKYNRNEKALELFKNQLYSTYKDRRKQEYEADSIGYVLFSKTKFKKSEFINALKLMETYDTIKPSTVNKDTYKEVFNLPNYPFKEEWFKQEDFSKYDYSKYKEKLEKDSLLTHPELVERIQSLKVKFKELKQEATPAEPSEEFAYLAKISKNERASSYYMQEEYGIGVYYCLFQLERNKDNEYYKKWLGYFLEKILEARKSYTLNRYLERVDPKEHPEGYQVFLNFMWNLSLTDIQNFVNYYKS